MRPLVSKDNPPLNPMAFSRQSRIGEEALHLFPVHRRKDLWTLLINRAPSRVFILDKAKRNFGSFVCVCFAVRCGCIHSFCLNGPDVFHDCSSLFLPSFFFKSRTLAIQCNFATHLWTERGTSITRDCSVWKPSSRSDTTCVSLREGQNYWLRTKLI